LLALAGRVVEVLSTWYLERAKKDDMGGCGRAKAAPQIRRKNMKGVYGKRVAKNTQHPSTEHWLSISSSSC
jgi:hypothetical protein